MQDLLCVLWDGPTVLLGSLQDAAETEHKVSTTIKRKLEGMHASVADIIQEAERYVDVVQLHFSLSAKPMSGFLTPCVVARTAADCLCALFRLHATVWFDVALTECFLPAVRPPPTQFRLTAQAHQASQGTRCEPQPDPDATGPGWHGRQC